MYNPITGQQQLWEWNAASRTWGVFVQDTWKARRNLTVTLGFRYDDQGNPWSRADTTVFGNFYLGEGATFEEQIANGSARPSDKALKRSPKVFNPRAGFAWDVAGDGKWVVRGGAGDLLQLADAGERAGGVPRQSAGPDSADLLRGHGDAADLRAGHERHAAVWIPVPAAGRIAAVSDGARVSTRRAAYAARSSRSAASTRS